ncbi:MAG: 30S ribosomal protein S2, partial [Draconibacterium sp.]|nr:30S ribosomal protein S2 [Draconibacterium sp.]
YVSVAPIVDVDVAVAEAPVVETPVVVEKPVVEEKPVAKAKKEAPKAAPKKAEAKGDNLTKLDGVGPKLAEILNEAGIATYADLAGTSIEKMKEILEVAGSRYASKDPAPWIERAKTMA